MRAHRTLSLASLTVTLLWAVPEHAAAQDDSDTVEVLPHRHRGEHSQLKEVSVDTRRGLWLQLGLGVGSEAYQVPSSSPFYSTTLEKPTVTVGIGGTVNQHFRLGGEFFGWFNEERGVLESVTSLMLVGRLYPLRQAGLYVKGGGGISRYGLDFGDCCTANQSDVGFGYTLGAGYELNLSRSVAIAPTVDLFYSSFSGRSFDTYHERVVNVGVSVVFQPKY